MTAVQINDQQLQILRSTLLNESGKTALHERFRALFMLKAVASDEVVGIISDALDDQSALLKHELAYVLGQMSNPLAIPILENVLINPQGQHCSMVRHEAAEALGALSSESSLPLLRKYMNDSAREVRETCEIAVGKIEWDHSPEGKARQPNPEFPNIDPAPPSSSSSSSASSSSSTSDESISTLQSILNNTSLPLFERYRAMFALRNFGPSSKPAIIALSSGFQDSSALFRHEIAFIFGQLSSVYSIPSLLKVLRDGKEDEMVRHEAAEALGGIASDGNDGEGEEGKEGDLPEGGVLQVLREWAVKEDAPIIVRESCQVAIDMWEYENSTDQFNPMDTLEKSYNTGMERSAAAALSAGVKA